MDERGEEHDMGEKCGGVNDVDSSRGKQAPL
jgi:hypothetical protein